MSADHLQIVLRAVGLRSVLPTDASNRVLNCYSRVTMTVPTRIKTLNGGEPFSTKSTLGESPKCPSRPMLSERVRGVREAVVNAVTEHVREGWDARPG